MPHDGFAAASELSLENMLLLSDFPKRSVGSTAIHNSSRRDGNSSWFPQALFLKASMGMPKDDCPHIGVLIDHCAKIRRPQNAFRWFQRAYLPVCRTINASWGTKCVERRISWSCGKWANVSAKRSLMAWLISLSDPFR